MTAAVAAPYRSPSSAEDARDCSTNLMVMMTTSTSTTPPAVHQQHADELDGRAAPRPRVTGVVSARPATADEAGPRDGQDAWARRVSR